MLCHLYKRRNPSSVFYWYSEIKNVLLLLLLYYYIIIIYFIVWLSKSKKYIRRTITESDSSYELRYIKNSIDSENLPDLEIT